MLDEDKRCLRIAAAGDLHYSEQRRDEAIEALAVLDGTADVVLLAGDLTPNGEPAQAAVLAEACAPALRRRARRARNRVRSRALRRCTPAPR